MRGRRESSAGVRGAFSEGGATVEKVGNSREALVSAEKEIEGEVGRYGLQGAAGMLV
ncbi:hypothetical protein PLEOSDRAFT_1072147 [Pleurotus ostreatus PC15]|uniref:Uncharacterized protein n=1 Tax=Pleurotus ostreatus (strain PC15) TaxID=1137138 RepID=A0A067N8F0_PLEO1|nr:hypothetical protein PLEOSDRAFT_1091108 [Pleurotus ostreatus PC15]KDQ24293.1 hypothetical protein PLEOSDRAFT_1072147 [Pleurotus ostreatus PC15]